MAARAMRGSIWTVAGFGGGQILRLGSNLILTRLLAPEAFGLMALINVFLIGLEMLSDIGIHAAIIHNERGDDTEFLCSAWTLGVIRGAILWILSCLMAWPAAFFYNEPRLLLMLPVSGLIVLITGFQTTAVAQHNRHMKLDRVTLMQLLSQAANLLIMVFLAWKMQSVWALVIGGVAGAVVQVALGHLWLPGIRHQLSLRRDDVRTIVHFGKWLFLATATGYLAGQAADKLALGRLVDRETLGIYSMAFLLAQLPSSVINVLVGRVLYPALADASRQDGVRFSVRFRRARGAIWPPLVMIILAMGFFGPLAFQLLWDSRYHAASWMMQLMLTVVWLDGLNSSLNAALLGRGESFASAAQNLVMLVVGVPGMFFGYSVMELPGLILGLAAGRLCAHIALHCLLTWRGISVWRQDALLHLIMVPFGLAIYLCSGGNIHVPYVGTIGFGEVSQGDATAVLAAIAVMICSVALWRLSLLSWNVLPEERQRGSLG